MLVATGYWPPQVPFDVKEMNTVIAVVNEERKQQARGR